MSRKFYRVHRAASAEAALWQRRCLWLETLRGRALAGMDYVADEAWVAGGVLAILWSCRGAFAWHGGTNILASLVVGHHPRQFHLTCCSHAEKFVQETERFAFELHQYDSLEHKVNGRTHFTMRVKGHLPGGYSLNLGPGPYQFHGAGWYLYVKRPITLHIQCEPPVGLEKIAPLR